MSFSTNYFFATFVVKFVLMKVKILFLLLAGASFFSCKTTPTPSDAVDYFVFGSGYCHCITNCGTFYKYTPAALVKGEGTSCQPTDYTYKDLAPGAEAVTQAEALLKTLPDELYAAADTTFGCPDCADQGTFHIEVKKGGVVKSWRIDTNEGAVPEFLQPFHQKIRETLEALKE